MMGGEINADLMLIAATIVGYEEDLETLFLQLIAIRDFQREKAQAANNG
jgi:hypothetical protein